MKTVIAKLVVYPQYDEDGAGHADGQAYNVDKGEPFASPKVPAGDPDIADEHG
jgi:hypothetical protein